MRSTTELAIQKRLRDKGLNKEEICKQTGIISERLEKLEKLTILPMMAPKRPMMTPLP